MKVKTTRVCLTSAVAIMSAFICAQTVQSQESVEPEDSAGTDALVQDEIIVTAQKRAESIRDVPIAMSAFSGETLEKSNVFQLYDLQRLAPSLQVDNGARADKPRIVIRGVGSSGGTAVEPSVATFIDGIYIPREGATLATYLDIEAVEILRGPQGTLFGRNASVGAISLRSGSPRDEDSASVKAEIGTGDRYKVNGYVNKELSDNVAIRFAGLAEIFEGLYTNKLTDDRVGGVDTMAGRLGVKVDFSENVEDTLKVTMSRRRGNDYFTPYLVLPNSFPPGGLDFYISRFAAIGSNDIDLDPFDTTINQYVDDTLIEDQYTIANELVFSGASGYQVKLISGYNRWNTRQRGNHIFGAETPTGIQYQHSRSKSHQEELQFLSPDDFLVDGLSAVAGLYYFTEDLFIDENFQLAADNCTLALYPIPTLLASCLANADGLATDGNFDQTTDSIAAYAQATYALTPTLDLTLGTRWSQDDKDGLYDAMPLHPVGALVAAAETTPLELTDSKFTYRANLTWKPTTDAMLFASYTTGFKSGGFNSAASSTVLGQSRKLRPETVESYELGTKTSWFDNQLQLDVVAYQMDVKDFQDRSFNGMSFAVTNAGGLRNRGVETDFALRPTDWFKLSGGVAYLDSEFTSYPMASNLPGLAGTQDLKGTRPTFSPEWTGNVAGEFQGDVGHSGMEWSLRGDVSFVSESNIGGVNDNNPDTVQDGYSLLSARATITSADRNWSLSVFGSNLTDEGYCTSYAYQPFASLLGGQVPGHSALRCNIVGTPRTFGASLSYDF
ncbi:MAG: TonB-dependent receptor [Hyphomonas sp.]